MKFKGSQTEKNLQAAFAGESQARNAYMYYADAARKAGYHQISDVFLEIAENEGEHARTQFEFLDRIKDTRKNLEAVAQNEKYERPERQADYSLSFFTH